MIGRTIGGYRIVEQVGMGGMATVYKAYDASTDRYVALKTLPEQFSKDPQFVERFRREARAIAKLEHLHILPLFAYGEDEGTAYLAMRYLPAGTLSNYIRQKGQIPLDEIARILSQISGALDHAHANGVLHRDIKPSNVLIDKDTNIYLTDFGIARMVEGSADLTGDAILGTPQYMSPEQCQARKDLTPASDQYSLGVVLYEMVTGRVPFQAETPLAVIIMQINGAELPLPTELRPDLPEAAERVILKALSREPADRYPTCEALSRAFTQAISENQPVTKASALPATRAAIPSNRIDDSIEDAPTTVQGVSTPASPNRMPLIIGGIVAAAVIIGLIALLARPSQTAAPTPTLTQVAAVPSATVAQIAAVVPSATINTEVPTPLPTATIEARATVVTATTAPSVTSTLANTATLIPSVTVKPTDTSVPSATPTVKTSDTPTIAPTNTAKPSATSTTAPTLISAPATATLDANGLPAIVSTLNAQGDTGAAISLLEPAIEKSPKDAQLYLLRGQAYQKNSSYDEAITDLTQAIKLAPDLVDAYVNRAIIYNDQGKSDLALTDLGQAIKLQPNRADAYALRGMINRNLNEFDKSMADYGKAVELDPKNPQWHIDRAITQEYIGNLDGAITDLTQAITLDPQSIAAYIQRGNDQRQKDQPDLALADFMKAREINPEDVSSYSATVDSYISLLDSGGSLKDYDLDKALDDANKALQIQSSDPGLWYLRGRIYAFRNEPEASISDFTQAIDLFGQFADAYAQRGYQYTNTGRFDEAHADFNSALQYNADSVPALQGRVEAYLEAVDNDKGWTDYNLDNALADAQKAVQEDTSSAVSLLLRGKVYGRQGEAQKALADLNQTIQAAPEMAWGYLERGTIYYSIHNFYDAINDFKKAITLDSTDAWSYVQLGDALYDSGQKKDALAAYQNYVKLIGSDQPVDYVSQRIAELEKGT